MEEYAVLRDLIMVEILKKLLDALIKYLKKRFEKTIKRWMLIGAVCLFLGFVAIVMAVWVMVAGW